MLKGITPLLAAVTLVAVTVGVAILSTSFISTTFQSTQFTIANKTAEAAECTNAEIVIDDVYTKAGDNGTVTLPLRNAGFSDNLVITSAQLFDKLGNNFSAGSIPVTDFNRGEIITFIFQLPKLPDVTVDSSAQNNSGILGNTSSSDDREPTWILEGRKGPALSFDGIDDLVNVSASTIFNI